MGKYGSVVLRTQKQTQVNLVWVIAYRASVEPEGKQKFKVEFKGEDCNYEYREEWWAERGNIWGIKLKLKVENTTRESKNED